jgi:hypothetical protein
MLLAMQDRGQQSKVRNVYCLGKPDLLIVHGREAADTKAQCHDLARKVSSACCESIAADSDRLRLH